MDRLSEACNEYLKASTVTNPNSYPPPHPHPLKHNYFPIHIKCHKRLSQARQNGNSSLEMNLISFCLFLLYIQFDELFDFQVLCFIYAGLLIKVEPYGFDWIRLWPFSPKNHDIQPSAWQTVRWRVARYYICAAHNGIQIFWNGHGFAF